MSKITRPRVPAVASPSAVAVLGKSLALMKPVTWFAPAWAFLCGAIASNNLQVGVTPFGRLALGVGLAGPILCGLSQVVNDYCDRDVDALNEPQRLIPSGQVTSLQVFVTIGALVALGLGVALILGPQVALLTAIGMVLAVFYSANPIRAKRNGWFGNTLVSVSYEGLPWLAGSLAFGQLTGGSLLMAALYSLGAHGIMTVNDFKSIEGDRRMGIYTIPVLYGTRGGAWLAVMTMNLAQLCVIIAFAAWGNYVTAAIIGALLLAQLPPQRRFLSDPARHAVFYNASGIMLFVWGMLVAAIGL
ncbi:MAG: chlorophyll synthase ChlG [Chloroflexales bacterium]|nr:chlorophyll synthase ChlG [Chloroflexales bacterium]